MRELKERNIQGITVQYYGDTGIIVRAFTGTGADILEDVDLYDVAPLDVRIQKAFFKHCFGHVSFYFSDCPGSKEAFGWIKS